MIGESSLADGSDSKALDPTSESSTNCGIRCECGALVSSIPPGIGELSRASCVFQCAGYEGNGAAAGTGSSAVTSRPSIAMRPAAGVSNSAIKASRVLLPALFCPITVTHSPAATLSEKQNCMSLLRTSPTGSVSRWRWFRAATSLRSGA